uniref:Uncharacterized protein n=1 Tax=Heterorhabditis bacteriophora TaxID=37862 RepID=A0A1I7WER7_HETBA
MEDFESTYVAFLSFSVIEGEIIGHVLHNDLEERNYDGDATIRNMLRLRLIRPKNPALEGRGFFPRSTYIVTFGVYSWSPPRFEDGQISGECSCMKRITAVKYSFGSHSAIFPTVSNLRL